MTIHEFLQGDKFALLAGVELLETGNGYAKARMLIKPEHLNGGGVCQGGAIFTLADLAFAAATNSHARLTLSITSNINSCWHGGPLPYPQRSGQLPLRMRWHQ